MNDDSHLHMNELFIAIKPIPRLKEAEEDDTISVLENVWSSMSSSMQMAKECLENDANAQSYAILGLEKFAQTIDNGTLISILQKNIY